MADIPVYSGDIFYISFPKTIRTPKEPQCTKVACLQTLDCTSEKGRIVLQLGVNAGTCQNQGATITFTIQGVQNSPSEVPNVGLSAYWTSKAYATVAEYSSTAPVVITN